MKNTFTKKFVLFAGIIIFLISCAVAEKPEVTPPAPVEKAVTAVSYSKDIAPIMLDRCTPCHYPEKGKKELLHTYDATVKFVDDIIYRIQLPADSTGFMPFKSKKPALSKEQVQLFLAWREQGLTQ